MSRKKEKQHLLISPGTLSFLVPRLLRGYQGLVSIGAGLLDEVLWQHGNALHDCPGSN